MMLLYKNKKLLNNTDNLGKAYWEEAEEGRDIFENQFEYKLGHPTTKVIHLV